MQWPVCGKVEMKVGRGTHFLNYSTWVKNATGSADTSSINIHGSNQQIMVRLILAQLVDSENWLLYIMDVINRPSIMKTRL